MPDPVEVILFRCNSPQKKMLYNFTSPMCRQHQKWIFGPRVDDLRLYIGYNGHAACHMLTRAAGDGRIL